MDHPRDERQERLWRAAVLAIVTGPTAASTPAEVARRLAKDACRVAGTLAELEAAGWLDRWDDPERGSSYTLTPGSAARLRVRLVDGRSEHSQPRWRPAGRPDPARRAGPDIPAEVIRWDRMPAADRGDLAAAWAERDRRAEARALPVPAHIVGLSAAWPIARCSHGPLPPSTYCAACDAWNAAPGLA